MTYVKRSKAKWTITIISFVMSIIMFGAFIFGIFNRPSESTDEVGLFGWGIGNVDENGKVIESKKSIYTKDLQLVSGLKITLDDEATITYKVAFYDEDKNYISVTDSLDDNYDSASTPETAKYFRIIVTPPQIDGEDVKINAFTVNKYAKQLEVIYNK